MRLRRKYFKFARSSFDAKPISPSDDFVFQERIYLVLFIRFSCFVIFAFGYVGT